MSDIQELLAVVRAREERIDQQIAELRGVAGLGAPGNVGGVHQIVMQSPDSGERAMHRVEKKHAQMVVLNICMALALVLNWITDTNQSYVINAIYMMAPGLQQQIEAKKEAKTP